MIAVHENLGDFVAEGLARQVSVPLLSSAAGEWSRAEAARRAAGAGARLKAAGTRTGDRVVVLDDDPVSTAFWVLGSLLHGFVFTIIPATTPSHRFSRILEVVSPTAIVTASSGQITPVRPNGPSVASPPHAAFFVLTSGTTSTPRAIVCEHESVFAALGAIATTLGLEEFDRIGSGVPLGFDYGLYQVFFALLTGGTVHFLDVSEGPEQLLATMRRRRISVFPATRAMLGALRRLPGSARRVASLRVATSTGDRLPVSLVEDVTRSWPETAFFSMYGLSECKRALILPPNLLATKPASVGRPIPGMSARVIDDGGGPLPPGSTGELVVSGRNVMWGYFGEPDETAVWFTQTPDGRRELRTGDLFVQDEDGDFSFVARRSGMIKTSGGRVSPREVEDTILGLGERVVDVVVYGDEHPVLGETVAACVVAGPGFDVADVRRRCRDLLGSEFVPRRIDVVDSIPVSPVGKYAGGRR